MTKSKKKASAASNGTNWTLIGAIVGVGAVVFLGLFIFNAIGNSEQPLTVGEIDGTRTAELAAAETAAEEQSTAAFASLNAYCDANPNRCIVEGDADSENVVFEFSDYSCPHCKTFADNQYPQIYTQLIETGEIKYITVPAPILGRTPNTPMSVNATLCAIDQGHGSEYHIGVYGIPRAGLEASQSDLLDLGSALGLDMETFEPCVKNETHADEALANRVISAESGINSTPTLLLNGRKVDASAQALNAALQSP